MRRVYLLFASRALCHVLFFFLGSTLNSGPHARTKHSTTEFSSTSSCSFFFSFCQLPIHSRALRLSVCCELQAADEKKSDSPTPCVFAFVTYSQSVWRAHVWEGMRKSTKRIVHVRFPYTLRTLSEFFHQTCTGYCTRSSSIGFSFSAFLWVHWNRNGTRAWSETTSKAWLRNSNT